MTTTISSLESPNVVAGEVVVPGLMTRQWVLGLLSEHVGVQLPETASMAEIKAAYDAARQNPFIATRVLGAYLSSSERKPAKEKKKAKALGANERLDEFLGRMRDMDDFLKLQGCILSAGALIVGPVKISPGVGFGPDAPTKTPRMPDMLPEQQVQMSKEIEVILRKTYAATEAALRQAALEEARDRVSMLEKNAASGLA